MSSEERVGTMAEELANHEFRMPTRRRLEVGEVIEGLIVSIGENDIFIDVGGKSEATIDRKEMEEEGELTLKVGDKLSAFVTQVEPEVQLSRALARKHLNLGALEDAKDLGIPVQGKVTGLNKGGLEVDFNGARGFCPISQIELGFCEDASRFVGESLEFRVMEVRENGRNIVVSRRSLLEEEQAERAEEIKAQLFEGAEFEGEVTTLQPFGAFVDLGGGMQGMVHVSQISHARIDHPQDVLSAGQKVRVRVMKIEQDPKRPERQRIGLSMKVLLGDPWESTAATLSEGAQVEGKVVRIQPFGAFVSLPGGVDGLIHISELADRHVGHPSEVVTVGDTVQVTVLRVEQDTRRIALSLKGRDGYGDGGGDDQDGAASGGEGEVAIGALCECVVDRIKPFGLFVKIKGGGRSARGLIPTEETGAGRNANLRRAFPEGSELKAMITEIDRETGKIKLSIKACADAELQGDYAAYQDGAGTADSGKAKASKSSGAKGMGTLGDLLQKALKK